MYNIAMNPTVRADKNITHSYLYFKKYSSDDSKLLFLLLVYFSQQKQQNLFGYGVLDPITFCKEMNLAPEHFIWRKHSNPKQLQVHNREDLKKANLPIYDTIFENALYCLLTDTFEFKDTNKSYGIKNSLYSRDGNVTKVENISAIQFIKSLDCVVLKEGKTVRKVYHYELSLDYINNLSFLFFKVNINSLSLSIKKNYDGLYLYLANLYNEMYNRGIRQAPIEFDLLKKILDINSPRASYVKTKITKALEDVINYDDLKDKFKFHWVRKLNHKYKYEIEIVLEGSLSEVEINANREQIWEEVRIQSLRNGLYEGFLRRYPDMITSNIEYRQEKYIQWLKDCSIDEGVKIEAYNDMCSRFDHPKKRYFEKIRESWFNNLKTYYNTYI